MKQNCFALRPGTIFGYKDEAWKILRNDTLAQRFTAERIQRGTLRLQKTFHYAAGQEISIRWKPDDRQ